MTNLKITIETWSMTKKKKKKERKKWKRNNKVPPANKFWKDLLTKESTTLIRSMSST